MRLVPRSRRWRLVLVAALLAVVGTWPLWREPARFVVGLVVPGPSSEAADRRSTPAPTTPATGVGPATTATTPPTADAPPRVRLRRLADLDSPTSVADPPGPGPVLVSTQAGLVVALDRATGATRVVADLAGRITSGGERGLLSIAVDPAGERLYADYTDRKGDTEIVSWPLTGGDRPALDLSGEALHLRIGQPFANHNGGNLVFGPDGALWIGTGDGGGAGDRNGDAQRETTLLGKMLRVVPRPGGGVAVPPGNRRSTVAGARPEIWAIGLRNPWRYSFDRATGMLWVADVGQGSIEEVTVVDPAARDVNFGWNLFEGDNPYRSRDRTGLTQPVHTYGHDDGCSVTGGYVYRGSAVGGLAGWYLFADFCGGWVRGLPSDEPARGARTLVADAGAVLSFGELDDGEILVCTREGVSLVEAA